MVAFICVPELWMRSRSTLQVVVFLGSLRSRIVGAPISSGATFCLMRGPAWLPVIILYGVGVGVGCYLWMCEVEKGLIEVSCSGIVGVVV